MSAAREKFPYPPLPSGVDAIRILTIEPGDFSEPLVGTLTPTTFSTKPRYVALSYTWEDPYPGSAMLPTSPRPVPPISTMTKAKWQQLLIAPDEREISATIFLNGAPFHLHHNLCLAMLHLRSPSHPLSLWVDAVCINQADSEERNTQVAIMSFIYTRAMKVVVWLGINPSQVEGMGQLAILQAQLQQIRRKELKDLAWSHADKEHTIFMRMSSDWKVGQTQNLAGALAGATKMRSSSVMNLNYFLGIAESSYWTRLWVVQEACLPRELILVSGPKMWTYEDFTQWEELKSTRAGLTRPQIRSETNDTVRAIFRVLDTRDAKFTDTVRLENLIEAFAKSGCSELRDRVYGLLGLANDTSSFSRDDGQPDPIKQYLISYPIKQHLISYGLEVRDPSEPKRGVGSFKVDYSRSFYDIWVDVILFIYFRAKKMENRFGVFRRKHAGRQLSEQERRIAVVRTAGIVQNAFDQMLEAELATLPPPEESDTSLLSKSLDASETNDIEQIYEVPIIRAVGYLAGRIVELGPAYNSFIASFRAQQEWFNSWDDHYQTPAELELLRRIDEQYTAKIMDYNGKDLARIRHLSKTCTVAWHFEGQSRPITDDEDYFASSDQFWDEMDAAGESQPQEPRICLGTNHLIAIVPPTAKVGDVVVRFWNCDAAMLMRSVDPSNPDSEKPSYKLLGRADVAEVPNREAIPGLLGFEDQHAQESLASRAVYVDMDLRTLQLITASISTQAQS